MNQIKDEAAKIIAFLLQNPPTPTQQWISGVVAVLVCAWLFLKIGDRMDLPNVGIFSSFAYTALGLAAVVLGVAAGHVYLAKWYQQLGPVVFDVAAAVALSLAVVVPLINMVINGKYMGTLTAWLVSVAGAIVATVLLINIYAFVDSGGQALQRGAQHNTETKKMLK